MRVQPYLLFSGRCEEAMHFYRDALGAHIDYLIYFKDSPMPDYAPQGWTDKVMRAQLRIGDTTLLASDEPASLPPQGVSVALDITDPIRAAELFEKLALNGQIILPLQPTPWTTAFGALTDRFGINWIFNSSMNAEV